MLSSVCLSLISGLFGFSSPAVVFVFYPAFLVVPGEALGLTEVTSPWPEIIFSTCFFNLRKWDRFDYLSKVPLLLTTLGEGYFLSPWPWVYLVTFFGYCYISRHDASRGSRWICLA